MPFFCILTQEICMAARRPKAPLMTRKHVARLERERRYIRLLTALALGILVVIGLLIGYGILEQAYLQYNQPVAARGAPEDDG